MTVNGTDPEALVAQVTRITALLEEGFGLVEALKADNARLRALVKAHEFDQVDGMFCSSCLDLWPDITATADTMADNYWCHHGEHHPDCPAFTPDGQVK